MTNIISSEYISTNSVITFTDLGQHLDVMKSFEQCVYQASAVNIWPSNMLQGYLRNKRNKSQNHIKHNFCLHNYRRSDFQYRSAYDVESTRINHRTTDFDRYQRNFSDRDLYNDIYQQPYSHSQDNNLYYQSVERCIKCWLMNHATSECCHRIYVQCFKCKLYRHKDISGLFSSKTKWTS